MELKPGSWIPIAPDATILTNEEMTDLRAIGITELKNMRLPPNLAEEIHKARVDATTRKLHLPPGAVFDPTKIVNIEDLPESHKQALKNYILQSQAGLNAAADVQKQVSVIVPNNPGIMGNLTKAMEVAAAASVVQPAPQPAAPPPPAVTRPGVIKSTPPPQTMVHIPPPPVVPNNPPKVMVPTPAAWSQNMDAKVPATPVIQSPPPAVPSVVAMPTMEEKPYIVQVQAEPEAGTSVRTEQSFTEIDDTTKPLVERCPRCAYNLKENKMVEDPTINDLIEYRAQAIIGGHRYYKEYIVFGGALRVTFRTLTQKEEDFAVSQVALDGMANVNNDMLGDDYLRTQKRYRMIMSIDKVVRGNDLISLSTYSEYDQGKTVPNKERLKVYYDQVLESVLTSSSLFNVVLEKFDNFDSYVAVMELRAHDPKSYPTTQGQ